MKLEPIRTSILLGWRQRLVSLYVPVFMQAVCAGIYTLVVPFEVHRLGGGAEAIGAAGALWTGSYVASLLIVGGRIDRFDPRLLVRIGLVWITAAIALTSVAPNLTVLFTASAAYGLVTGLFWPPIMGWISTGHEGLSLNRRLSLFNVSWSSGMVIGPLVGGVLYKVAPWVPFGFAIGCLVIAMIVVNVIRSPEGSQPLGPDAEAADYAEDVDAVRNAVFKPMARISHFLSYAAMGMFRYQLPSLAIALGITTDLFGRVGMALSGALALSFCLLGRTHRWHYRLGVFLGAQIALAGSCLALLIVSTWWHMALVMIVGGACVGVTYSSNLFYGVSGGTQRGRSMAIHEFILSVGIVIGSFGSGWITEHVSLRIVYPLCAGLVALGALAQVGILLAKRARRPLAGSA